MEQLRRDLAVVAGPSRFHGSSPGVELYLRRIEAARNEIIEDGEEADERA